MKISRLYDIEIPAFPSGTFLLCNETQDLFWLQKLSALDAILSSWKWQKPVAYWNCLKMYVED